MEKIRTIVRIAGKDYALTGYDSEEYVKRVARYVDRKLTELEMATRLPIGQLAVLTAVNIADDMLKSHDENTRLKKELEIARMDLEKMRRENQELKDRIGE